MMSSFLNFRRTYSDGRSQRPVVGREVFVGVLGRVGQVPGDRAVHRLVRVGLGPAE